MVKPLYFSEVCDKVRYLRLANGTGLCYFASTPLHLLYTIQDVMTCCKSTRDLSDHYLDLLLTC